MHRLGAACKLQATWHSSWYPGQAKAGSPSRVLLQDADALQLLHDVPRDGPTGALEVGRAAGRYSQVHLQGQRRMVRLSGYGQPSHSLARS